MKYDIFYVSKNKINNIDWQKFRSRFPSAQKIDHVASFDAIKKKAFTKFFWVIWDDITLLDSSIFDFTVSKFDEEFTHVFKNGDTYDGICLFSKHGSITKKEFDHRFFVDKKEVDIIASKPKPFDKFVIENYQDYLNAVQETTTDMFWAVWPNVRIVNQKLFDTYFSHHDTHSRTENHVFLNVCYNQESFVNGVILFAKHSPVSKKEIEHKYLINKKEHQIVASCNQYSKHIISNYDQYLKICNTETQPLFWCQWPDIEIINEDIFDFYFDPNDGAYDYDRTVNHMFKNSCNGVKSFIGGVVLFSTNKIISQKEFDHRFLIDKKEQDRVVSRSKPYEKFVIDTFADYTQALETSTTDMFWAIPPEVEPLEDFQFDLIFSYQNDHQRSINHVFENKDVEETKYNGIMLLSKQAPISAREIEHRYLIEKKEYDIVASKLKLYDIVFISYNEPNADENFIKLQRRFPRVKRVHGVKGIHEAHIAAAKLSTTPMFWAVDGDAVIEDNFEFNLLLPRHDTDIVHVWLSKNPVNHLTYGYGGVKLLPRQMTIDMDVTSVDMTMSISNKFKVVNEVSNVTAFNTDPFATWKSAFRECVKLASRPIDSGYQEETEDRIITWCNIGADKLYGEHCISGARAGRQYGLDNITNSEALVKINDFEWLQKQFDQSFPMGKIS